MLGDGVRTVAAIVAGDRRLDRRKVQAVLGTGKLRFATADEVAAQTGYPPGGVAPLAFVGRVDVVVDAALVADDPLRIVHAGGGRPELLLRIAVADLVRHNGAVVAAIS